MFLKTFHLETDFNENCAVLIVSCSVNLDKLSMV